MELLKNYLQRLYGLSHEGAAICSGWSLRWGGWPWTRLSEPIASSSDYPKSRTSLFVHSIHLWVFTFGIVGHRAWSVRLHWVTALRPFGSWFFLFVMGAVTQTHWSLPSLIPSLRYTKSYLGQIVSRMSRMIDEPNHLTYCTTLC